MRTIGKILLAFLATLGLLTLLIYVGVMYAAFRIDAARPTSLPVSGKIVLALNLDEPFVEGTSGPRLEGFNFLSATSLQDAVIAIRRAKDDPRVVALKATVSNQALGLAQIQDIRDAVAEFRAGGKPTYLFSESMGEGEGALPTYYLAAAFGDIWVQPSGTVGIAGIGTDNFFLKRFLERFGVKASFLARGEYKSAPETLTNTAMSPANREETKALLGSWLNQIVTGIAENRALSPEAVSALVDKGPLIADEALQGGLINHVGYRDEFDSAIETATSDATEIGLGRYLGLPRPSGSKPAKKHIALIHAAGEISRGEGDAQAFVSESGIYSERMARAIREAAEDEEIDALLFRVDSPGGSYVASDTIWREIERAKQKKKPIIVSMGNTAASGGYFISMGADRIFAQPATVTGSIGVYTGKVVIGDALAKLDINHERIAFGESAGTFSAITDFSAKDVARINQMLDRTYADFTGKAAKGRGKTMDEIDKVARGRVWTGVDAVVHGLVDELGGFAKALDYTKTQIGLKPEDAVRLVPFPEPDEPWWALFRAIEGGELPLSVLAFGKLVSWLGHTLGPVMGMLGAEVSGRQTYMAPIQAH